jgi:tetratricopeptide (TPR) repeat protein
MTDWYRRKTWTKTGEEEYFAKLGRARKDSRPQYLRVQAIELIETKDEHLLQVAERLLHKLLTDYPNERIEKSQAYKSLGDIYKLQDDFEKALDYFKRSIDFEKEFPNVRTSSYLGYSEVVIRANKTELFDYVESLLTAEINSDTLKFPFQNYIIYSVLSIINDFKGNNELSKHYSDLAEKYATANSNGLWNPQKKKLGLVGKRLNWLDKLVRRK